MTYDFHAELAKAIGNLSEQEDLLHELKDSVEESTGTVSSRDRAISVTADGRGAIASITFNSTSYRTMSPTELGRTLVDLIGQARQEVFDRIAELYEPVMPDAVDFGGAFTGDHDPVAIFTKAVEEYGLKDLADRYRQPKDGNP
jgi:DNA-binding protein YbaB